MKILLTFLATYLVLHAQVHARSGVPWPTTPQSLAGTYAGVLLPQGQSAGGLSEDLLAANTFAIFSIGVGATGFSTGRIVIFVEALAFTGTVTGFGAPSEESLVLLVDAASVFDVVAFDGEGELIPNVKIFAAGLIAADVDSTNDFFGTAQTLLTGNADLNFSGNDFGIPPTINYRVNGFKQSNEVATITAPPIGPGI